MARQIVEKHGFNEQETARLLGLSQSAVSRYISKERGNLLAIEGTTEILALIDQMVLFLIKEPAKKVRYPCSFLPNMSSHSRKRLNVSTLPKRNVSRMGGKMLLLPLNT